MAYTVRFQEEGRGPVTVRSFPTLKGVQAYVRERWQGVEYMDGRDTFHTDYCLYWLQGVTLYELGSHAGDYGTGAYWDWTWKEV
jgi:hypothetical protein